MAIRYWTGRAASVAQVTKVVFSSIVAGQTYSVTINGKTVSIVAASTSLLTLIDSLIVLWSSSIEPEHQECLASQFLNPTLEGLRLDAVTPSSPITITAAATTGSATVTVVTAASGPTFWKLAGNWDGGTLPAAADDLVLEDFTGDILDGLTDALNYATIDIRASFEGAIGRPPVNPNGYPEYRQQALTLGTAAAQVVNIGFGAGNGSSFMALSMNGNASTITVSDAGQVSEDTWAINLFGVASGTLNMYGGRVRSSTGCAFTTVNVIKGSNSRKDPVFYAQTGSTVATLNNFGGRAISESVGSTAITVREQGELIMDRTASAATVTVSDRANIYWDASGGITTMLNVEDGGNIDFSRVATLKTVAACKLFAGGSIQDPWSRVTFTGGVVLQACRIDDVNIDRGIGVTI